MPEINRKLEKVLDCNGLGNNQTAGTYKPDKLPMGIKHVLDFLYWLKLYHFRSTDCLAIKTISIFSEKN
jgi:hypothetical protein